ncbi:MAG: hypothetical protein UY76_C0009G0003 [Candidatus Uhrbacteria bacterium GW2011_GWA2_52_8d]|uniref:Uncharacterized protein n=1 Tax=Candidatus Uhrbacteria bacterium GW2011_GWA2_52_8d TaxID=1618979 RepID=A0A0G1ZXG4_9BACT|nr:MAG: hypothetical protein UY76_C0009G0003 [Candidatus Uhrbacteria bacterium GW2011_GWA2_52_8d]
MIDARHPNYSEILFQAEELKDLITKFEKNISLQVPQGIVSQLSVAKNRFVNWIEEVEFTLEHFEEYD